MTTNHNGTTQTQVNQPITSLQAFELFAEELPAQTDFTVLSTIACVSTGACSCVFSTAGTLTTKACVD